MFCWHELVTAHTAQAAEFYREILGGTVQAFPMPAGEYAVLHVDGAAVAGFQPANAAHPMDAPSQWLSYVAVDDVDATCARATDAGATIVTAPHDMPIGRAAIMRDPQGARLALFRGNPDATDGTNPCGPGAVCWMELETRDVAAASAFYARVLGWTIAEQKMPFGDVHVARVGKEAVCSICQPGAGDTAKHSRWVPYFEIASVDSAAKRIRALGGRECTVPMDLPSLGRWFPAIDSVGAEVALMELERKAP